MELLLQGTQALLVRVVVKVVLRNSNAKEVRNGMWKKLNKMKNRSPGNLKLMFTSTIIFVAFFLDGVTNLVLENAL